MIDLNSLSQLELEELKKGIDDLLPLKKVELLRDMKAYLS